MDVGGQVHSDWIRRFGGPLLANLSRAEGNRSRGHPAHFVLDVGWALIEGKELEENEGVSYSTSFRWSVRTRPNSYRVEG